MNGIQRLGGTLIAAMITAMLLAALANRMEAAPARIGIGDLVVTNLVPIETNKVPVDVIGFMAAPALEINELGAAPVPVLIVRQGGGTNAASVDVIAEGITAQPGVDFAPVSQTVSFAPGIGAMPVFVSVMPDALAEGPEHFRLRLLNPRGAGLGIAELPITIIDAPAEPPDVIQFTVVGPTEVAEGGAAGILTLTRQGSATGEASVRVTSIDGSAQSPTDYPGVDLRVTFPPGSRSQTVSVQALADDLVEGPEFFGLRLAAPVAAVLGANADAQVIIRDVPPAADLELTKVAGVEEFVLGEEITFTLTLANKGPSPAMNIAVRDHLPAELAFVRLADGEDPAGFEAANVRWNIPQLPAGASRVMRFVARVTVAANFENQADVERSGTPDPDSVPGNRNAAEDDFAFVFLPLKVDKADLALTKEVGVIDGGKFLPIQPELGQKPTSLVGKPVVFRLSVSNLGPDAAKGVLVADTLPAGFKFEAAVAPGGTAFDKATGKWTVGALAVGATMDLLIETKPDKLGDFENQAVAAADTDDPVRPNNVAKAAFKVVGATYCAAVKLCGDDGTAWANRDVTLSQGPKQWTVKTDAHGAFCFRDLIPGDYKLVIAGDAAAGVPGFTDDPLTIDGEFPRNPITYTMPVRRISGTVTIAGQNAPLPGVSVTAQGKGAAKVAVTDANGRYSFVGFAEDEAVEVTVAPLPFPKAVAVPKVHKVQFAAIGGPCDPKADFAIRGGFPITGKLAACNAKGLPIPDAEVTLGNAANAALAKVRTDSFGRFTFTNIPPGKYTLTASHPSYAFANPLENNVNFPAAPAAKTYVGTPNGVASGRVINGAKEPLPDIQVRLISNLNPLVVAATATTDQGGRFSFAVGPGVPAGQYLVAPVSNVAGLSFTPVSVTVQLGGNACAAFAQFQARESVVELMALEVVQVTQDWRNSAPLVAGKPTVVRAFLRALGGANKRIPVSSVTLLVNGDGGNATLRPVRGIEASNDYLTKRDVPETSLRFDVPAKLCEGAVTFTLSWNKGLITTHVNAEQTAVRNNATTVNFQNVAPLPVRWVLVDWRFGGKNGAAALADLNRQRSRILHALPLSQISPAGRPLTLTWRPSVDPTNPDNDKRCWADLTPRFNALVAANQIGGGFAGPFAPPRDDIFHGIITGTKIGGAATGIPANASFADMTTDPVLHRNTPAHELGHVLGRHHSVHSVYGVAVIGGVQVKKGACDEFALASAPDFPMDLLDGNPFLPVLGPTTRGIYREGHGWDAGFDAYVSPKKTADLMSYCEFTTKWAWSSLNTHGALFGALRNRYGGGPARARRAADPGEPMPYLVVRGEITDNGTAVELAPLRVLHRNVAPAETAPGPFFVRLLGAGQILLEAKPFLPQFELPATGPLTGNEVIRGAFNVELPLPPGLVAVEVTRGDMVLGRFNLTTNAPVVQLTAATLDEGRVALAWQANDADGDALRHDVQFSADDGANWQTLAAELTETEESFSVASLGGAPQARFRIVTTDGYNRTASEPSAALALPDQPPVVALESPADGETVVGDREVTLRAAATDLEDGEIGGDRLVWRSDRDGELGTGSELMVPTSRLSEGDHRLTVTATDSAGQTGEASRTLTVHRRPSVPLQIIYLDGAVEVGWPVTHSQWRLQGSHDAGSGEWFPVTEETLEAGEHVWVRFAPESDETLFFRLAEPVE